MKPDILLQTELDQVLIYRPSATAGLTLCHEVDEGRTLDLVLADIYLCWWRNDVAREVIHHPGIPEPRVAARPDFDFLGATHLQKDHFSKSRLTGPACIVGRSLERVFLASTPRFTLHVAKPGYTFPINRTSAGVATSL